MSEENDNFGIPEDIIVPKGKGKGKAEKVLDPEEDKENWPTIFIDFEDGKPNYEFLGCSGTMKDGRPFTHTLQVMRGVDVKVPPSIVNMLRTSREARYHQVQDPVSGRLTMVRNDRSSIPWRMTEKGKYC